MSAPEFFCEGDTLLDPGACREQCRMCRHEVDTAMADPTLPAWMHDSDIGEPE